MDVSKYGNKSGGNTSTIKTEFKAGTQMGRISQVICMGTQHQTMWDKTTKSSKYLYWKKKEDQVKGANNQTYIDTGNPVTNVIFKITVEFPKVRAKNEDGEDIGPGWLSKEYNPRSKQLLALLEPTGSYEASNLAGMAVMCPIGFSEGGNAKILSIAAAPEGVPVDDLAKSARVFDFYEPDLEAFNALPNFIQNDIKKALDFSGSKLESLLNSGAVNQASNGSEMDQGGSDGFDDSDCPF